MHLHSSLLPCDFTGAHFLHLKVWDDLKFTNGREGHRFLFRWIFRSYLDTQTGNLQGVRRVSPTGTRTRTRGLGLAREDQCGLQVPREMRSVLLQVLQTCSKS